MCTGEKSPIVATAMSDAFQVYNAKDFPGMKASTALTKRLKEQGCLISIKKGNESGTGGGNNGKRASSKGKEQDTGGEGEGNGTGGGGVLVDSDEDEDEDEGNMRVRKKAKRSS